MKILSILGVILIILGAVDLAGSYADFDLWGDYINVKLPDMLWKYSSYIELGAGFLLFNLGSKSKE